jgi:hypothetical protein
MSQKPLEFAMIHKPFAACGASQQMNSRRGPSAHQSFARVAEGCGGPLLYLAANN